MKKPRAKAKREAPKVEAWIIVTERGDVLPLMDESSARAIVAAHQSGEVVRLVPADPLADAVVAAARKWWRAVECWKAWEADDSPRPGKPFARASDRAEDEFWRAVEALEQRK